MTVKSPALSGVTAMSVVLPAAISVSILSGFDMKPCTRSELVSLRIVGSPFLSVIWLGENSNFFALISITLGVGSVAAFAAFCARARLTAGGTNASPISHMPASKIVLTMLLMGL